MTYYLVIEPFCRGFEHAKFNAALLATLSCASQGIHIRFVAEATHQRDVQDILGTQQYCVDVEYVNLDVNWPKESWRRFSREAVFVSHLLCSVPKDTVRAVFLSSVTSSLIIALKEYMAWHTPGCVVVAIPHGVLAGIASRGKRFWNWPIGINRAVRMATPDNLHFLALSRPIFESVARECDMQNWHQIEHPYIFDAQRADCPSQLLPPVSFGLFGAVRSGLREFCEVAQRVKTSGLEARFCVVGHIHASARLEKQRLQYIDQYSLTPLTYSGYESLARGIAYGVWCGDPRMYQYSASTTILDLLNFGKPAFYLRNRLVSDYFARLGELGYICDTMGEIANRILEVASAPECHRIMYERYVTAIDRARDQFTPDSVAMVLRASLPRIF